MSSPKVAVGPADLAEQAIRRFIEIRDLGGLADEDAIAGTVGELAGSVQNFWREQGELLAGSLTATLMESALQTTDWRERWKFVNRAAGAVCGWSFAAGDSLGRSVVEISQAVLDQISRNFDTDGADRPGVAKWIDDEDGGYAQRVSRRSLVDGLAKRIAEIFVALEI